ncbi:FMN-binding protein [Maribellus maritimus]|uniref:FMN-binding protein n=1 Tax=Maribellus maritimus TaxID=2870838 RepID=UPI001EEB37A8|nr:FMN-binding protein [Maribellus maritimus]MCG6189247.1 FMN-binding protein [Maribellus maritimus]
MLSFKNIFILFFVLFSGLSYAQEEIDYAPKMLMRALKTENINFSELQVADISDFGVPNGKFFKLNKENSEINFVYVGRVNSCRSGGCSVDGEQASDGFEFFDYFILFDRNLSISQIKVFNYQATKGHEITARSWLKQFIGYKGESELLVGKHIDGISGATVSAHSLTADVEYKTGLLIKIHHELE